MLEARRLDILTRLFDVSPSGPKMWRLCTEVLLSCGFLTASIGIHCNKSSQAYLTRQATNKYSWHTEAPGAPWLLAPISVPNLAGGVQAAKSTPCGQEMGWHGSIWVLHIFYLALNMFQLARYFLRP